MRLIGLHVRYSGAFSEVIDKASSLSLPIFQTFFKQKHAYISLTSDLIAHYDKLRSHFSHMIAHSSYVINLAQPGVLNHYSLKKELKRARKLQFTHMVFHPGAVTAGKTRHESLDTIAKHLNQLTKQETDIEFILENSAHGKKSLGGDIQELSYIQARLDHPEKVTFCIDTAHAYVFGYSIQDESAAWVEMVCKALTPEAISLIHANDTHEPCGSFNDRHCVPGQGKLGAKVLKNIIQHPLLADKPVILELPVLEELEEIHVLNEVRSWCEVKK